MVYLILLFYILLAGLFFTRWLDFFLEDEMTLQMRWFSSLILLIATIFWPITVPFAYLELLKFHKKNKQIINLLMTLSNTKVLDDAYLKKKFTDSLLSVSNHSNFKNEDN